MFAADEVLFGYLNEDQKSEALAKLLNDLDNDDPAPQLQTLSRLLTIHNDAQISEQALSKLVEFASRDECHANHAIWRCLALNRRLTEGFFERILKDLRCWIAITSSQENQYVIDMADFAQQFPIQSFDYEKSSDSTDPSINLLTSHLLLLGNALQLNNLLQIDRRQIRDMYVSALCLAGSCAEEIALAAREICIHALRLTETAPHDAFTIATISEPIWTWIVKMNKTHPGRPHAITITRLWFQWVTRDVSSTVENARRRKPGYWSMLKHGLAKGNAEERKFYLAILLESVRLLKDDLDTDAMTFSMQQKALYAAEYQRYCVLFQTIVLDRYQNQIEECMDDLESIICGGIVHATWIETLVSAVLEGDVQDTIRNPLGKWYMALATRRPKNVLKLKLVHRGPFLNWANNGVLWTQSVAKKDFTVVCPHAQDLRRMHQKLLEAAVKDEDACEVVRAVVDWAYTRRDHLYPFTFVTLLGGFADAAISDKFLRPAILDAASLLALTSDHRKLVRTLLVVYCTKMREFCKDLPSLAEDEPIGIKGVRKAYDDLVNPSMGGNPSSPTGALKKDFRAMTGRGRTNTRVGAIYDDIRTSSQKCLTGSGLLRCCKRVLAVKANTFYSAEATAEWRGILRAIWDETQTQEYPKDVIICLPRLFLRPQQLAITSEDDDWISTVTTVMNTLYSLAKNRIYLLYPVMSAIRLTVMSAPASLRRYEWKDLLTQFANEPPQPKPEYLLEVLLAEDLQQRVPYLSYASFEGPRESVGYACTFDFVNRLTSLDVRSTAKELFETLLAPWASQKPTTTIVSKWKKTENVQMLVILSEICLSDAAISVVQSHLDSFYKIVSVEPLPRYRYLFEWMVLRVYIHHPSLRPAVLQNLEEHSNPRHTASLLRTALKIACLPESGEDFARELLFIIIPLCASAKVAIRHEAQWCIPDLWNLSEQRGWEAMLKDRAFESLKRFVCSNDKYASSLPARQAEAFDPISDHTLCNLFTGPHMDMYPPATRVVSEADFLYLWADDRRNNADLELPKPCMPLGMHRQPMKVTHALDTNASKSKSAVDIQTPVSIPLQTKGVSFSHPNLDSASDRHAHPLILCGSLIDNSYNLGGLSRAGEIFGASSLLISSIDHVSKTQFTSVSVTSHLHFPISELTPEATPAYLQERKREGYTILGVEQTDQSKVLGTDGCKLPRKCVLVMGSEKEGIPARVLVECDMCVEIRQEGRTRSLNVQTAACVVLYEYQRQWGHELY